MNILITCCGRKLYLIKEIRRTLNVLFPKKANKVFVTESDRYSPSLYYADKGFIVPPISDGGYLKSILNICLEQKVSVIIPTKDTELSKFSRCIQTLNNKNIKIPLAAADTIEILEDKLKFYYKMNRCCKVPLTYTAKDIKLKDIAFPCIVKERGVGVETSGFHVCDGRKELNIILNKLKDPIIQEKINGTEYTVDALFNMDGFPVGIIPRVRLKTREYVSDVGVVVKDEELVKQCKRVAKFLNFTGIANFQWIKDEKGVYYLIEINPRVSGGLQITLAACPQFIPSLIKLSFGMKIKPLNYRSPVLTMKYDSVISTKLP